jgi:glycosyltransferase involved in cell wall biosynthesis
LIGRGHDVTVIATSIHKNSPTLPKAIKTMSLGRLRVPHRLLGMDLSKAYHDFQVARHLRSHPKAYDLVHCWPGAALITSRAARAMGIPSVREVPNTHTANAYEVVTRLCDELGLKLPRGHSHRPNAERLKHEEAEYEANLRLLVPSDHVAETFIDRGYPSEKLLRHRYGFDPKSFAPKEPRSSAPKGESRAAGLRAVFVGSVEPRKGLSVALEAWRRSKAYERGEFSIYGTILDGYGAVIEPYLSLPGVKFHGFTPDTVGAFQSSDVLILPSYEEGSALVTYEAQGCGVVPLTSDASGAECIHQVTGLIHRAGDVDELAGHIRRVIEEPDTLEGLRDSILRRRDGLTWAAAAERLEQCYELACEACPRSRAQG